MANQNGKEGNMESWRSAVCLALSTFHGYGTKCAVRGHFRDGKWHYTVSALWVERMHP